MSEVVQTFISALNAGDAQAAAALLTANVQVNAADKSISSLSAAQGWLNGLVNENTHIEAVNLSSGDGAVTWNGYIAQDSLRRTGIAWLDITGKSTVQNGKIQNFSYSLTDTAKKTVGVSNVVLNFIKAQHAGDVDAAVASFAPDAEVILAAGTESPTGVAGIRAWQEGLKSQHFHLEYSAMTISDNVVSWTGGVALDVLRQHGLAAKPSMWKITVENGKISHFKFEFLP